MSDERKRARGRARRAALAVTLALGLGGCYGSHDREERVERADAGSRDAGRWDEDAGRWDEDAGWWETPDAGRADAGLGPGCLDYDCASWLAPEDAELDGECDWGQHNACCDAIGWAHEACLLPGGPLSPPEMPA